MNKLARFRPTILPRVTAAAHCDVPCGIYDPTPAKMSAKTVQRMVLQLKELAPPKDSNDAYAQLEYFNAVSRRISVKEEHSGLCKKELQILWSDFFKPEHLAKYPDLHAIFWKALKLCSQNRQTVDEQAAIALVAAVDEIAKIFYDAKNDPKRFSAYKEITDKLF